MNRQFKNYVELLEPLFRQLVDMTPVKVTDLPGNIPSAGIYLFSEHGKHLYVGRSNSLRRRLQTHSRPGSQQNQATFAFLLTRKKMGYRHASYTPTGSRKELVKDPEFKAAFDHAKARIRKMDIRFVGEGDPLRQALLELYVAIALGTPHNDFDTH